jgi:hypothetical protein
MKLGLGLYRHMLRTRTSLSLVRRGDPYRGSSRRLLCQESGPPASRQWMGRAGTDSCRLAARAPGGPEDAAGKAMA